MWKRSFQVIYNPGKVIPSGKMARSFPEFQIQEINELKTFGKPVAKQVYCKFCYVFFQQEDLQEMQKYGGVPSRKSDVGLVVIRDVSAMMPIHQSLGQAYTWVLYTTILITGCFIA